MTSGRTLNFCRALYGQRHAKDKSHIDLTLITHFYCNQMTIESVTSLLRQYETYPDKILDRTEFIIVDDCSPLKYDLPELNLNFRWLRITTDIPWNQGGARNLGVTFAKSDKIVMSDLDHAFPADTLKYLVNHPNPGRNFYKLWRKKPDGSIYKGHANLFFMSRARFLRFYGYDEEFSGHYGAEDYRFVKYQKYQGSRQGYLPKTVYCYERSLDREQSYHSLTRDLSANTPVDLRKKNECSLFGKEAGHSRLFLNFEWVTLAQGIRRPASIPTVRRYWRLLWWWRWLNARAAK
ncbi:glycosyltransferase family A protein [Pantoea sp. KPR_PJ]|uniref:glycosyltransferase family A protein n=1 Tax=Pantoea sp. KPR_PJ TaxID=2738375 RepID=UPI0035280B17